MNQDTTPWSDLLSWAKGVIGFLILLLMGIVNWTIKKHVKRLEDLEDTAARKTDVQQLRNDMEDRHEERKEETERRHVENTAKLDRIETRVDEMYRLMLGRER
jgi:hypothetical protein